MKHFSRPHWQRLGCALLSAALAVTPALAQRNDLPNLGGPEGLSASAERQWGDRIARVLYRDPDYLQDAVLDEYIARLWAPLIAAAQKRGELDESLQSRFAWRILLNNERSINAFALPGGYLGVNLGLIATVSSDDELASVLAHELSHVTQRHIARSIDEQARMTPWVIGSLILGAIAASHSAQGAQALIVGGQAAAAQAQLSYSRDMEREADRVGFGVMRDAGYDPRGFVGMFGKLQQAATLNDNGDYPYLRSHPLTTERIADMQARQSLLRNLPPVAVRWDQALLAARARVLAPNQVDALRALAASPAAPQAAPVTQAGSLYASALAHLRLKDFAQAWAQSERLMQLLQTPTAATSSAQRLTRLLQADIRLAQRQYAAALPLLGADGKTIPTERPERLALAQALLHLPGHAMTPALTQALRQYVQLAPHDAQTWNTLGQLYAAQNAPLAALRAEGEAQAALLDWTGAIDRFRAAQDLARKTTLQAADQIEAAIIDSRLREIQNLLRAQQLEDAKRS